MRGNIRVTVMYMLLGYYRLGDSWIAFIPHCIAHLIVNDLLMFHCNSY